MSNVKCKVSNINSLDILHSTFDIECLVSPQLSYYKKMKPTLLILAAGMGSRYGGIKQLDQFGPNGETIIDYSLYDAIRA